MIKQISFILMLFLSLTSYSYATDYLTDLEDAKIVAKENDQNILLIFSADYCKFCKNLKDEILVSNLTDNLVVCVIDIENNKILSRKYRARNLPTSIILDHNFQETTRIVGYNNEKYVSWLEKNSK